ncbi:hypothetical protein E2I00_011180 [Balaenoptera physalus]|uniref:Sema domain-containing protein n=1 Tax=Balaenoptera physalus TaxID=9770 RepID=A0A6A1Q7B1_BALPH|nr:hypothetical protein E2I00_011180 [Balaenoptera physalus]
MVFPGPLAITLLPPSLTLLVVRLASSQDVASEPSSEQQLCSLREHPIVAFAGTTSSDSALPMSPSFRKIEKPSFLLKSLSNKGGEMQATEWASNEDTRRSCQSKGKTEEECQNYVRVLIVTGRKVFMCGTNAFSPVCSSRQVGNLSRTVEKINGVARCPYDPRHNSTAVISSQGELYAATVIDFSGRDPAIYRSLGSRPPLRTAQYNSKWLNEPNFVAAYDIGLFAYFLLRENAVEHDCGRTVYSRVARVCKNDMGGRFLLEDTWTTFMKARLNCSRPGEVPFYYNELQSAFHLPEQDLIYGVFTTNVAISQVFNGPFRYQENPRAAWLPIANPIPNFQAKDTLYHVLYIGTEGWSPWSEWSACTEDGVQSRGRHCEELVPGPSTCAGNSSQSRPCPYREIPVILPASSVDEATGCGGFSLIHLVATGISCFLGSGLLTLAVYLSCQHCRHQSQESTLTLNKNNLIPDDRANFYPLQQTNVYTTTYYPSPLNKHSFRPEASPGQRCFPNS